MTGPRATSSPPLIPTKVTYLQMFRPPDRALRLTPPVADAVVMHAARPSVAFYRYLYNTVGRDYLWSDRRALSDEALAAIVQDRLIEVHVLYVNGEPAGYAELDRRSPPEIELAYFGLMPGAIGAGLGKFLIDWSIDRAFSYHPARYWLHTCDLDHPRALEFYKRAGFVPYKETTDEKIDPHFLGLM